MASSHEPPDTMFELLHSRSKFITALNVTAHEKRELADTLDVSRSTVDRALRELETAQLVKAENGHYRVTFYGRLLLAVYHTFLDTVDQVQQAQPLLALLPPDIEIDFTVFFDAEVQVATDPALHLPATRVCELIEQAEQTKALAYANTASEATDVIRSRVDDGMPMEVVFRREMYASLMELAVDSITDLLQMSSYHAYVIDDVPFGLFLFEIEGTWEMCLVIYGPNKNLKGIIVNDDPTAVSWAQETYEYYRTQATRVQSSTHN